MQTIVISYCADLHYIPEFLETTLLAITCKLRSMYKQLQSDIQCADEHICLNGLYQSHILIWASDQLAGQCTVFKFQYTSLG
jgi:hypothetical protein